MGRPVAFPLDLRRTSRVKWKDWLCLASSAPGNQRLSRERGWVADEQVRAPPDAIGGVEEVGMQSSGSPWVGLGELEMGLHTPVHFSE
jgi:hypothetical protein